MKPKFRSNRLFAGTIALFATMSTLHAADGLWSADANGNWSDTANWDSAVIADGTGFTATFPNIITSNRTVTLDAGYTIGNITASDTGQNFTVSGANTLTLDVTSGASILDVTTSGRTLTISTPVTTNDGLQKDGAGNLTFGGPITLGAAQTWTNNSAGSLNTGNGANLIDNGGFQLTVDGTGTHTFGTINSATVALTGSGNLVKNGSGRLNIGGVNSGFTGTVTLNGGVTQVTNNSAPLGDGNLTLNGGVFSFYWGTTYTRTLGTGTDQVQILGGESGFAGAGTTGPSINLGSSVMWGAAAEGSGATGFFNPSKFVVGDEGTGNAASTTFSSGIDLNGGTRTIKVPAGLSSGLNRPTISGAISNSTGTGNLNLEIDGILTLSNNSSSWNGSTAVSGSGYVNFGGINENNIGDGSARDITVAAGGSIRFNALSNDILNRIVETGDEFTLMSGSTSNNLDFGSSAGANLSNAFLGHHATNGAKMEYGGTLTPASDNYRIGASVKGGVMGMLNTSSMSGTQGLIVQGYVELVGPKTFSGDTVVRTGARLGLAAIAGDGGEAKNLQNSVLDVDAGDGTIWLEAVSGAGPMSGAVATTSAVLGGLKGSRNLSSVIITADGGNNVYGQAVTDITGFTLNTGTGVNVTYSGSVGGFGTGATGGNGGDMTLTKTGDGTQILDNTSTYTGATTVSAGILGLGTSGSIATSASLAIAAGATLDTSAQSSFAIPGSQPIEFGVDAAGSGSAGKITAAELDISSAVVTYNISGTPDDAAYVLATYTNLVGANFASVPAPPSGYTLNYAYEGNKIALVSGGGPTGFAAWQSANSTAGTLADDHDGDGVDNGTEYFLGGTANTTGFTALPGVTNTAGTLSVTWTKAASYAGAYTTDFVVQTSATLAGGSWTAAPTNASPNVPGTVHISGNNVTYTFPAGTKLFARLKVTGP